MNDHLTREQNGRLAGLLREQLNEMMIAAHGLSGLVGDSEKGRDYLALMNRGLHRQLRLTRHLELMHRLSDEDEIRLNLQPVDAVEVCRDLMNQVESILRECGIRAALHTSLNSLIISADRARLEDMLLCLISNSVKAVGENGSIDLTLECRNGRILFLLSDNGGGVSAEALAEFFDCNPQPYEEPTEITLKLGLPLARKIASLHGGFVIADNYAGTGMRLAVILPMQNCDSENRLYTSIPDLNESGWNRVLIELSDSLPAKFFTPEELSG